MCVSGPSDAVDAARSKNQRDTKVVASAPRGIFSAIDTSKEFDGHDIEAEHELSSDFSYLQSSERKGEARIPAYLLYGTNMEVLLRPSYPLSPKVSKL